MSLKLEVNKSIFLKKIGYIVLDKVSGFLGKNKVETNFIPYIKRINDLNANVKLK